MSPVPAKSPEEFLRGTTSGPMLRPEREEAARRRGRLLL